MLFIDFFAVIVPGELSLGAVPVGDRQQAAGKFQLFGSDTDRLPPFVEIFGPTKVKLGLLETLGFLFLAVEQAALPFYAVNYLLKLNRAGYSEHQDEQKQNADENHYCLSILTQEHEHSQSGIQKGHAIDCDDGLGLCKTQVDQSVVEMAAVGGKYGPSLQKTAQHGKKRIEDRDTQGSNR